VAGKDRMTGNLSHLRPSNADKQAGRPQDERSSAFRFFHQSQTARLLESVVIPEILARKKPGDTVRAWVVDCDTGQEAYAIAMLLAEATARLKKPPA
jgi:two-component system, chemotaxis family, CheB/CheR fusion protein